MSKLSFFVSVLTLLLCALVLSGCGGGSSQPTAPAFSGPHQVYALFPPLKSSDKSYNDVMKFVVPNSSVAGVTAALPWNAIESNTTPGAYDFSGFDALLQPFLAAGKIVNLDVQAITEGGINKFTPTYVFGSDWASTCCGAPPLDVVTCDSYPGDGSLDSGIPVYTESPFVAAYKNFVAAVIKHYSNNSNVPVGYLRFGTLGVGGEAAPLCTQNWPGFTKNGYLNLVQDMMSFESSQHGSVRLLQNVHAAGSPADIGYADTEAGFAIQFNFAGFGNNGARVSDIAAANSGQPCSSDWCALFDKYAGTSVNGSPIILQLQTFSITDPTNESGAGSLTQILPFVAQHHVTLIELFIPDLLLAFDPNYANTPGANPSFTPFASSYAQAIQSFVSGQ